MVLLRKYGNIRHSRRASPNPIDPTHSRRGTTLLQPSKHLSIKIRINLGVEFTDAACAMRVPCTATLNSLGMTSGLQSVQFVSWGSPRFSAKLKTPHTHFARWLQQGESSPVPQAALPSDLLQTSPSTIILRTVSHAMAHAVYIANCVRGVLAIHCQRGAVQVPQAEE